MEYKTFILIESSIGDLLHDGGGCAPAKKPSVCETVL
jgi:hypothetical protein